MRKTVSKSCRAPVLNRLEHDVVRRALAWQRRVDRVGIRYLSGSRLGILLLACRALRRALDRTTDSQH